MKQYNIEVFTPNLEYKDNSAISEYKYKYDYLDPEKVTLDVLPDVNVALNDYIQISDGIENYIGIVTTIKEATDGTQKITVSDVASIFDVDIVIDTERMNGNLEDYISARIDELFISNTDSYMNIPATISTTTATADWKLDVEPIDETTSLAEVNLFDDIILPAFTAYGVVIRIGINLNTKQLTFTVGYNEAEEATIESDLPNVIEKDITIQKIKKQINKVIVHNTDDYTQTVTYYLHSDGTFDTENEDRLVPVNFDIAKAHETTEKDDEDVETVIPFEQNAYLEAEKIFQKNKYDNLIELEVFNDDILIKPYSYEIGQKVNIIVGDTIYHSIFTGKEVNQTTKMIFGTIRLELTKILKGRA